MQSIFLLVFAFFRQKTWAKICFERDLLIKTKRYIKY
jgi:hypothetical protein